VLRLFPDTTGIEEDYISVSYIVSDLIVTSLQQPYDSLRIIDIHLTAVGFDEHVLFF
jgi:hypothetical protein